MLVEMRSRSQITLPVEIVKNLGLGEGDRFDVTERDGGVFLCPVVVYPKSKLERIARVIKEHKDNPAAVYESVDEMFKALDINLEVGNVQT